jgi:tetratricopeptide (TPR) repeat protein
LEKSISARRKAQTLARNGDLPGAIEEMERVILAGETDPYDFVFRGDLLVRMQRSDEAVVAYEEAVTSYERIGLYRNAIAVCKKVLRTDPSRRRTHGRLGDLYAKEGLTGDAIAHFLSYLDGAGDEATGEEFLDALERVAQMSGQRPEVTLRLAELLVRAGREEQAAQMLRDVADQAEAGGGIEIAHDLRNRAAALMPGACDLQATFEAQHLPPVALPDDANATISFYSESDTPNEARDGDGPRSVFPNPVHTMRVAALDPSAVVLPGSFGRGTNEPRGATAFLDEAQAVEHTKTPLDRPEAAARDDVFVLDPDTNLGGCELNLGPGDGNDPAGDSDLVRRDVPPDGAFEIDLGPSPEIELIPLLQAEFTEDGNDRPPDPASEDAASTGPVSDPAVSDEGPCGTPLDSAIEAGDWPLARDLAVFLHEQDPDDLAPLEKLVMIHRAMGDTLATVRALTLLGDLKINEEDLAGSLSCFLQVLELDPDNVTARRRMARFREMNVPGADRIPEECGNSIQGLLENDGATVTVRDSVAGGQQGVKSEEWIDLSALLQEFREGVSSQIPPDDAAGHYDLGVSHREMGLYEESIEEFSLVISSKHVTPALSIQARELRGDCLEMIERHREAIHDFRLALETEGRPEEERTPVRFRLACALEAAGETEEALAIFRLLAEAPHPFLDTIQRLERLEKLPHLGGND